MMLFSGLSRTARVMIVWVIALCLLLLPAGLAAIRWLYPFERSLPYLAGLALGCVHSVVKTAMMEKSIIRVADMEKDGAESIGRLHFFGRYLLTAAVFILVILSRGAIGLYGTIAGVLSLQFAAYITGNLLKNKRIGGGS